MFKAIGLVLILISLAVFVFNKVENKKQKFLNFCEMKRAISFLKHELSFSAPELSLLCKRISDQTSGEISQVFKETKRQLEKESSIDFYTAWENAAGKRELFSEETQKIILELIKGLGKKSLDIEIENIEKTQKALETLEAEEKEKYLKERKLIYTLGTAAGAVILILAI